jgi:hypothetical protein
MECDKRFGRSHLGIFQKRHPLPTASSIQAIQKHPPHRVSDDPFTARAASLTTFNEAVGCRSRRRAGCGNRHDPLICHDRENRFDEALEPPEAKEPRP